MKLDTIAKKLQKVKVKSSLDRVKDYVKDEILFGLSNTL